MSRALRTLVAGAVFAATAGAASSASAQTLPPPDRNQTWGTVSTVSALVGMSSQLLMPRLAYSDSEATIGWKARWHASVLAPLMTLTTFALLNEYVVKPEITSYRPGCGQSNPGVPGCTSFGMPSTHSFVAFSALGHGSAVFIVDTLKWNEGKVNAGAVIGNVALPLVAATLTAVGRTVDNPSYEHTDQMLVGGAFGLGFGLLLGATYSMLRAPDCGYGSGVLCW